MEQNSGKKLLKGTIWIIAARIGLRGLSVISTMVLAWLLTPADFGLVAMASIVTTLMMACTEIGMNQVIVYYKNTDKTFFDTAWTLQMIRGLALGLIMLLFSNRLAAFYNEQLLVPVFRVLSLVFILNGLISTNVALFQKEMRFDKEFHYRIITHTICLVFTISLALWLRNYWAMVLGNIAFQLSCVILSFWFAPNFPRITLLHWRKILCFSQWVFLREASVQVSLKLDQIMIGKWFGKTPLGQYGMATQIAALPATEIALPLSRSLFPALAKLQNQSEQFRYTFTISMAAVLLIALPASFGLMQIAKPLILLLLPARWEQTSEIIQILTLFGLVRVVHGPCSAALTARGKVNELFFISISNLILKYGILYLGYIYNGLIGVAWGTVVAAFIYTALYLLRARHHNFLDFGLFLKQIWRSVTASAIMIVCVYGIQQSVVALKYGVSIEVVSMVLIGFVTYCATLFGLWYFAGRPDGIEKRLLEMTSNFIKKT